MKHLALCSLLAVSGCAAVAKRAVGAPKALVLSQLVGRWHVVATTFPMWRDRCDVTFNYAVLPGGALADQVEYREGGRHEAIVGTDRQHAEVPTHFTWRGDGLLALFKSEWDVVAIAPDESWLVLAFGETLATPAGVDVISRRADLDEQTLNAAIAAAGADPEVRDRAHGLYRVRRCE